MALMFLSLSSQAQSSQLLIEEYMVHDGENGLPELTGQTTYRYYVQCTHPDDFVSAVYGGEDSPLTIELESPMFNSPFANGSTGGGINPIVLNYFPEVGYDSWITIGLDQSAVAGESDISAMESPAQPFLSNFASNGANSGESVMVTDASGGAWFVLSGMSNGYAGDDLRVLIMQITTASVPTGLLNVQVIPAVGSSDSEQVHQGFAGTDVWDVDLSAMTAGCMDELACNYDALATEDDGSCEFDSCSGCTDLFACNFEAAATTDDGSCEFLSCLGCTDLSACNYDPEAIYNDGTCDYFSCEEVGCTLSAACNYNPDATVNDGSCEYISCSGCTDPSADNFDPEATIDDDSCQFAGCLNPLACNFNPEANTSNGSCDFESCVGCLNPIACNYDDESTIMDVGVCIFAEPGLDCDGNCLLDADLDGVCDENEMPGCTDPVADNYNEEATDDDASCLYTLLGCDIPSACNYNPLANENDNSCEFESCAGCAIETACNFDASNTLEDNTSCVFPDMFYDCNDQCLGDNDGDGVCNELEILGCTDNSATNYSAQATDNNGSCAYEAECHDPEACNYVEYDAYCVQIEAVMVHDGLVGDVDLSGMTTYRVYALCGHEDDFVSAVAGDNEFPTFVHSTSDFYQNPAGGLLAENSNPLVFAFVPSLAYDSWVTIGLEGPADGSIGEVGVSVLEGNEPWIAPFESGGSIDISDDLGGLWYVLNGAANGVAGDDLRVLLGQFTTSGNLDGQMYMQFFIHGDGVNNGFNKLVGLQDACGVPTFNDCSYPENGYNCEGSCLEDTDGDGICNEFEIVGCTDALANNFDATATDDDGSCDFTPDPCAPDATPPFFTWVPADSTIQCDQPMPIAMALAADECDGDVQVMFVDGPIEFVLDCPPFNYLCTRTFTATDDAGNVTHAVQLISVVDTVAPEYLVLPEDMIEVNEQEGEGIPEPFAVVQDACDGNANWSSMDLLIGSVGGLQTVERTYTATDQCGNASVVVQTILVTTATYGCMDAMACNYLESATNDDGSCTYPEDWYACDGSCLNDADADGVCDALEVLGCVIENACNFNSLSTEDDGSCEFCSCAQTSLPVFGLEIDTVAWHTSGDLDGMATYRIFATTETSSDFVSSVYGNDMDTLILASSSAFYQDPNGALLPQNLNLAVIGIYPNLEFDSWVTIGLEGPTGPGETPVNAIGAIGEAGWMESFESGGNIVMNDPVGGSWFILNEGSNGVAGDDLRVLIAQVTTAGNLSGQLNVQFFENGDNDNASLHHFTFEGTTWTNALSGQNACGCTDDSAFNFDPAAEYEDASCLPVILGCLDVLACNFNVLANTSDSTCFYADVAYDCNGICLLDSDEDGVCDLFEIEGCTDMEACNFDGLSTDDDGTCAYASSGYDCDGTCLVDADGDGICDEFELAGCAEAEACNYNAEATDDDGSCFYANAELDCSGDCLEDSDADGVCDAFEIEGCTDAIACNFNADATDEDGSCDYAESALDCFGNCLEDADDDGVCDEFEVEGCTDEEALNFDSSATDDNGSCVYCALEASSSVEHVSCNGEADGTASVIFSGAYPDDAVMNFVLLPDGLPQNNGEFAGLSAGEYAVQATDASGCQATVMFEVLEPDPLLVLLDEVVGTDQGVSEGSISISVIGGVGEYVYAWEQLDGTYVSDLEDLDNLEGGAYRVTVSDENGCSVTSFEIVVETIVGVLEGLEIQFSMFPNPVVDLLTIQVQNPTSASRLHVHDASGRLLHAEIIPAGAEQVSLDCSNWSSGMYHVFVTASDTHSRGQVFIKN